ncbi:PREDICTED: phospholipid scramblase 2-like [Diuraphis noxia]|uniref:phospholipid scramblase 2-like n=1 Tax=Diuraphis noxia TaxID=143948 RepID=UPI000763AA4F|nr:PREDICTED: phospholipid scramblase 2-like [Diuraphis noxia]XP_015368431.1 PREDICTED: phospholipid scramblase 2-like [Diuraphis noxia]
MYTNPNVAPAPPGFSQYHSPQNQYPPAANQNQYPPIGHQNQYPPVGNQSQPYQHDQYNMYQHQQPMPAQQNLGYPNYPPPYSQPGYGQVIQHQPSAYQPSPQVVADGWMPIPQAIPQNCPNGLQYLSTINQLLVKQQVEVIEALLGFETNNKYTIKNSAGQKVFYAVEDNDCCTRNCCGPIRPFEMKILDNYKNEVIHLSRPLACQSCLFPCCLQRIEVFSPPGCLVGIVEQDWSILTPIFTIRNAANEEVLKIEGPICRYSMCGDVEFKILSKDKTTVVGRISKQWSGLLREVFTDADFFGISFPMDLDVRMKAVMLGACFLIDVMFYEKRGNAESDGIGLC